MSVTTLVSRDLKRPARHEYATKAMPETSKSQDPCGVTVLIPAFNEEQAIAAQIRAVEAVMQRTGWPYEMIVVDDGSTDGTAGLAQACGARLIKLPQNRGYGAALKAGAAEAEYEWVLMIDADGTYPAHMIPALLNLAPDYDMVVGARTGEKVHIPLLRRPPKWFLRRLAIYLVQQPIPDLNSGLRVIKKSLLRKYQHLLPSGFSLTSTITLLLLYNGYSVRYLPIEYKRRIGASKIRSRDALRFLIQVLRMVMLFNPHRVFLPLGTISFTLGLAKLCYDLSLIRISDGAVMGILGGILIWCLGLLADQNTYLKMPQG